MAELALSLLLSGDMTLPEMRPGHVSLNVRTLIGELHEGLFLTQLLLPPKSQKNQDHAVSGEQGLFFFFLNAKLQQIAKMLISLQPKIHHYWI